MSTTEITFYFKLYFILIVNSCKFVSIRDHDKKSHCIKISLKKYVYIIFSKSIRQEILVRSLDDSYCPDKGAPKTFPAKKREKRKDQSFHCWRHIVQVDQGSDTINVNTSQ